MGRKHSYNDTHQIIDCAFELITEEGFSRFSTRRLAAKLGISKSTAYNYLQNKECIIELVVQKAIKIFYNNVFELIESKNYQIKNFYEILLVNAEVLYDFVMKYGDIYKLAYRELSKSFEKGISIEERFQFYYPLYQYVFPDFKYSDFTDFNSREFLDRYYYISMLNNQMVIIELNRVNKMGKEEHMRSIRQAWSLLTQCPLPW